MQYQIKTAFLPKNSNKILHEQTLKTYHHEKQERVPENRYCGQNAADLAKKAKEVFNDKLKYPNCHYHYL